MTEMKTLKVALLVTTAAGAVAAGGVTYATVGNSSPAPSAQAAQSAKDAAVAKHLPAVKAPSTPGVPAVPTCVPNLPKHSKALAAAQAKVKKQIEALAAKAPATPVTLPALPGKLPTTLPAAKLAKLPVGKLPTCKAGEQKTQSAAAPKAPALPALPSAVDCAKVPAVIKNEEAKAKSITLPNGATFGVAHAHKIVVQSRAACVYTQALVGSLPGTITVDRITTPPQVTVAELAHALKMPGKFVSVSGVDAWQTPTHNGILWYSDKGYAVRITGSNPAAAALLPGIASQLRAK
jgi:hypothetical protein